MIQTNCIVRSNLPAHFPLLPFPENVILVGTLIFVFLHMQSIVSD